MKGGCPGPAGRALDKLRSQPIGPAGAWLRAPPPFGWAGAPHGGPERRRTGLLMRFKWQHADAPGA